MDDNIKQSDRFQLLTIRVPEASSFVLYSYKNMDYDSFINTLDEDIRILNIYCDSEEGDSNFAAQDTLEFLRGFYQYINGQISSKSPYFKNLSYRIPQTGKLLVDEMVSIYDEIVAKSNGEEATRNQH